MSNPKTYSPFDRAIRNKKGKTYKISAPRELNRHMLDVFIFIHGYKKNRDYSPSVRDILEGCHISSTSVVNYYVEQLQKLGYIDFLPHAARTLHLTQRGKEFVEQLTREGRYIMRQSAEKMNLPMDV